MNRRGRGGRGGRRYDFSGLVFNKPHDPFAAGAGSGSARREIGLSLEPYRWRREYQAERFGLFVNKTVEAGRSGRTKNASEASDRAWGWGSPRRVWRR